LLCRYLWSRTCVAVLRVLTCWLGRYYYQGYPKAKGHPSQSPLSNQSLGTSTWDNKNGIWMAFDLVASRCTHLNLCLLLWIGKITAHILSCCLPLSLPNNRQSWILVIAFGLHPPRGGSVYYSQSACLFLIQPTSSPRRIIELVQRWLWTSVAVDRSSAFNMDTCTWHVSWI